MTLLLNSPTFYLLVDVLLLYSYLIDAYCVKDLEVSINFLSSKLGLLVIIRIFAILDHSDCDLII